MDRARPDVQRSGSVGNSHDRIVRIATPEQRPEIGRHRERFVRRVVADARDDANDAQRGRSDKEDPQLLPPILAGPPNGSHERDGGQRGDPPDHREDPRDVPLGVEVGQRDGARDPHQQRRHELGKEARKGAFHDGGWNCPALKSATRSNAVRPVRFAVERAAVSRGPRAGGSRSRPGATRRRGRPGPFSERLPRSHEIRTSPLGKRRERPPVSRRR